MSKKKSNKGSEINHPMVVLYIALLSYVAGIVTKSIETMLRVSNNPSDLSTADTLNTVSGWSGWLFALVGIFISAKLAWRYWPFRSVFIVNKFDERQREMRAKVMEWSYRSFGVWALATLMFTNMETSYSRSYTSWMLLGLFFFMPSFVAMHRKGA